MNTFPFKTGKVSGTNHKGKVGRNSNGNIYLFGEFKCFCQCGSVYACYTSILRIKREG